MKLTNEQLTKVKQAKNAEELLALAKENGIELAEEEAAKFFADLNKEGEFADEELGNVVGGCGGGGSGSGSGSNTPPPKFAPGNFVRYTLNPNMRGCVISCDGYEEAIFDGTYVYHVMLSDKSPCPGEISLFPECYLELDEQ